MSTAHPFPVAADGCVVSPQMSQGQKTPCLRESRVMLDQPTLTIEQLTKGPEFDPANPEKSRFAYFTPSDTLTCYFRPHFAFIRDKGQSLKFLCWQMDGPNAFFDRTGKKIEVDDAKVVISKDPGGESRAHLFARSDSGNANEIKADSFKVKYLSPPFPNHDKRLNEVFTEVAAARLLWALGFPADHMYSAAAVRCIGCGSDPFKDNLKDNKASLKDTPTMFRVVAIERLLPWEPIEASNDETWPWAEAHALYASGWSREQQIGFDAYRLALGMLAYHNPLDSQNRLACAEWKAGADNPKSVHAAGDSGAGHRIDVREARLVRQLTRRLR